MPGNLPPLTFHPLTPDRWDVPSLMRGVLGRFLQGE